jgi:DNA (cytosine-5)-methyltransferase 1
MNELALFAGHGGGILGGILCGFRTVCAVEIDDYARRVLMARQDDGCLPAFPLWDDVRTFDGRPWRGVVDIISGGFPCQDISIAGPGAGLEGERSGLWREMRRIVGEVGPRFVLVENSPALTYRGLHEVLGDLAAMGYDARWGVLGAVHAGAPHKRDRIWIVADSGGGRCREPSQGQDEQQGRAEAVRASEALADAESTRLERHRGDARESEVSEPWNDGASMGDADEGGRSRRAGTIRQADGRRQSSDASWWATEPDVGRVADGMAWRVDRLSGLGNGQVPAVVRLAWNLLSQMNS